MKRAVDEIQGWAEHRWGDPPRGALRLQDLSSRTATYRRTGRLPPMWGMEVTGAALTYGPAGLEEIVLETHADPAPTLRAILGEPRAGGWLRGEVHATCTARGLRLGRTCLPLPRAFVAADRAPAALWSTASHELRRQHPAFGHPTPLYGLDLRRGLFLLHRDRGPAIRARAVALCRYDRCRRVLWMSWADALLSEAETPRACLGLPDVVPHCSPTQARLLASQALHARGAGMPFACRRAASTIYVALDAIHVPPSCAATAPVPLPAAAAS